MHQTQSLIGLILESNLINFVLALTFLLYLLLKFLPQSTLKRKQELQKEIADALETKQIAEQKLKDLELAIEEAKAEALNINQSAKESAESLKQLILKETKEQILKMQENAEREIEQQRAMGLESIKKQIATIVAEQSEKLILERKTELDKLFVSKLKQELEDAKTLL
jgi:F-type H+-transporting ATPase subunit b